MAAPRNGSISPGAGASPGGSTAAAPSGPFAFGDRTAMTCVPFSRVHSLVRVRPWTEKEAKMVPEKQAIARPGLELCGPDENGFRTGIIVLDPANRFKPRPKGRYDSDCVLWSYVDETLDKPAANSSLGDDTLAPGVPATQADVYAQAGAPLVDCLMEGFNVACAVTGAPGTDQHYTLWGDEYWAGEPRGIIPRFLFDLFERQQKAYREDIDSKVELEVYAVTGENIVDMLRKTKVAASEEALKVREDTVEGAHVTHVAHVVGGTRLLVEDVLSLEAPLKAAIQRYAKSHSSGNLVVSIRLTDIWTFADPENPEANLKKQRTSTATFLLLNGSHLVMQRCLDAAILRDSGEAPQAKVPSRDSNLTRLVADIFGGNCNLTYVNTISPHFEHTKEAITSLTFASKIAVVKCRSHQNTDNSMSELRKLDDEVRGLAEATAKENDTISVVQNELDHRTQLLRDKQQVAAEQREAFEAQDADRMSKKRMLDTVAIVRMKHQKKNQIADERSIADQTTAARKKEIEHEENKEATAAQLEKNKITFLNADDVMAANALRTEEVKVEITEHKAFEDEVADQNDIVTQFDSRQAKIKKDHFKRLADFDKTKKEAEADKPKAQAARDAIEPKYTEVKVKHDALMKLVNAKKAEEKQLADLEEEERKLQKENADLDEEIKKLKDEKAKQGCCVVM